MNLELPGLVAGFPRTPEDNGDYVQALSLEMLDTQAKRQRIATDAFPADTFHRVDRQLVNMVADARERLEDEPYPLADKIHLNGFSGSATFSFRFSLLHPDRVNSLSAGGSAAAPLPLDSQDGITLPYPLGTADYQTWVDRSFDRDAWKTIDQYMYLGEEDQPLPTGDIRGYYPISRRYRDRAEDVYGQNRVTERLPLIQAVYDEVGANAEFTIYENVGHEITPEVFQDYTQFHRETSNAQHAMFEFTLRRSEDQVMAGTPLSIVVQVNNRLSTTATATPTFYIDGSAVETIERDVDPDGSTTIEFEHTFEEPGSYTLSINGEQVGESPLTVTEPTPTPTPTSTATSPPATQSPETTSATGPGFGVGAALASIAGVSYLLKRDQDG